jgi:hypothetical protein
VVTDADRAARIAAILASAAPPAALPDAPAPAALPSPDAVGDDAS